MFQIVEHRHQLAQAAAQPAEFPNDELVAVFELPETGPQGSALRRAPNRLPFLKTVLSSSLLQGRKLQFWLEESPEGVKQIV